MCTTSGGRSKSWDLSSHQKSIIYSTAATRCPQRTPISASDAAAAFQASGVRKPCYWRLLRRIHVGSASRAAFGRLPDAAGKALKERYAEKPKIDTFITVQYLIRYLPAVLYCSSRQLPAGCAWLRVVANSISSSLHSGSTTIVMCAHR